MSMSMMLCFRGLIICQEHIIDIFNAHFMVVVPLIYFFLLALMLFPLSKIAPVFKAAPPQPLRRFCISACNLILTQLE
jgi:hypothetical protein